MNSADETVSEPFVGPRSLGPSDRIFGRDADIDAFVRQLIADRIVLLYSRSGAGKTSMLEAAVRGRLQERGFVVPPTIRAAEAGGEAQDLSSRANDMKIDMDRSSRSEAPSIIYALEDAFGLIRVGQSDTSAVDVGRRLSEHVANQYGDQPVCVIIDQFEELFTASQIDHAQREAFFVVLGTLLTNETVWCVLSMREEYLADVERYARRIPRRLASRRRLLPLTAEQARAAIVGLIESSGAEIEAGAGDLIVDRLMGPQSGSQSSASGEEYVDPVRLQVVCQRMWRLLPNDNPRYVSVEHVSRTCDPVDALRAFYDDVLREVSELLGQGERHIREWIEDELIVEPGYRGQVTADRVSEVGALLRALQRAYLVTSVEARGTNWFELAHDQLVEPVLMSNAQWREDHLPWFSQHAADWVSAGRPEHLLISGSSLERANQDVGRRASDFTDAELDFVSASNTRRERERFEEATQRRVQRRTRRLAIAFAVIAVFAMVSAVIAWNQRQRAIESNREAERSASSAQASAERAVASAANATAAQTTAQARAWAFESQAADDPAASATLALQALATSTDSNSEAQSALLDAVARMYAEPLDRVAAGAPPYDGDYREFAWVPDTLAMVLDGQDGQVLAVDDLFGESKVLAPALAGGGVDRVSPTGQFVAVGRDNGTVELYELSSGNLVETLLNLDEFGWADSVDRLVGVRSADLVLWDSESGVRRVAPGEADPQRGTTGGARPSASARDTDVELNGTIAWSPGGDSLAIRRAYRWEYVAKAEGRDLDAPDNIAIDTPESVHASASWSPDGSVIAFPVAPTTLTLREGTESTDFAFPDLLQLDSVRLTSRAAGWVVGQATSGQRTLYYFDAEARTTTVVGETEPWVSALSIGPAGDAVVWIDSDGSAVILDHTGSTLARLEVRGYAVDAVWAIDGSRVAVETTSGAEFFTRSGTRLAESSLSTEGNVNVEWAPNSVDALVWSAGTSVEILVDIGRNSQSAAGRTGDLGTTTARWSSDGANVATLDRDGALTIWRRPASIKSEEGAAERAVAAAWDSAERLWHVAAESGTVLTFDDNFERVDARTIGTNVQATAMTASHGRVVVADGAGALFAADGSGRFRLVGDMTFPPERLEARGGNFYATGPEGQAALLDGQLQVVYVSDAALAFASIDPQARFVIEVDEFGRVDITDLGGSVLADDVATLSSEVASVTWTDDGRRALLVSLSGSWLVDTLALGAAPVDDVVKGTGAVSINPTTGDVAYIRSDGAVYLLDADGNRRELSKPKSSTGSDYWRVSWSPGGKRLLAIVDYEYLWWKDTQKEPAQLPTHEGSSTTSIWWAPGGERAVVDIVSRHAIDDNGTVDLAKIAGTDEATSIQQVAASDDSAVVLTQSGAAGGWNLTGNARGRPLVTGSIAVSVLSWSPDGSALAVGTNRGRVWIIRGGESEEFSLPFPGLIHDLIWRSNSLIVVRSKNSALGDESMTTIDISVGSINAGGAALSERTPSSVSWTVSGKHLLTWMNGTLLGIADRDGIPIDAGQLPDQGVRYMSEGPSGALALTLDDSSVWAARFDGNAVQPVTFSAPDTGSFEWAGSGSRFVHVVGDQATVVDLVSGALDTTSFTALASPAWIERGQGDEIVLQIDREHAVVRSDTGSVLLNIDTSRWGPIQSLSPRPHSSQIWIRVPDRFLVFNIERPLEDPIIIDHSGRTAVRGWSKSGDYVLVTKQVRRDDAEAADAAPIEEFWLYGADGRFVARYAVDGIDMADVWSEWDQDRLYFGDGADGFYSVIPAQGLVMHRVFSGALEEEGRVFYGSIQGEQLVLQTARGAYSVGGRSVAPEERIVVRTNDPETFLSASESGRVESWSILSEADRTSVGAVLNHSLAPDSTRLAVVTVDGDVRVARLRSALASELQAVDSIGNTELKWSVNGDAVLITDRDVVATISRDLSAVRVVAMGDAAAGASELDWSPDGSTFLVGHENGELSLVRSDGRMIASGVPTGSGGILTWAWSPTGPELAVLNNDGGGVILAADGRVVTTSIGNESPGRFLSWSAGDGDASETLVVAGSDGHFSIWRADGSRVGTEFSLAVAPEAIAISGSQAQLAVAGADGEIVVFRSPLVSEVCRRISESLSDESQLAVVGTKDVSSLACNQPSIRQQDVGVPLVIEQSVRL